MNCDELLINLKSLQRFDCEAIQILDSATQVAVYIYNQASLQWDKADIEGALFVYKRRKNPVHAFMILNRLNTFNKMESIVAGIQIQLQPPYLLYRTKEGQIHGIWFYDVDDHKRIGDVIQKLANLGTTKASESLAPRSAESPLETDVLALFNNASMKLHSSNSANVQKLLQSSIIRPTPVRSSHSIDDAFDQSGNPVKVLLEQMGKTALPSYLPPVKSLPSVSVGSSSAPAQHDHPPTQKSLSLNDFFPGNHQSKQPGDLMPSMLKRLLSVSETDSSTATTCSSGSTGAFSVTQPSQLRISISNTAVSQPNAIANDDLYIKEMQREADDHAATGSGRPQLVPQVRSAGKVEDLPNLLRSSSGRGRRTPDNSAYSASSVHHQSPPAAPSMNLCSNRIDGNDNDGHQRQRTESLSLERVERSLLSGESEKLYLENTEQISPSQYSSNPLDKRISKGMGQMPPLSGGGNGASDCSDFYSWGNKVTVSEAEKIDGANKLQSLLHGNISTYSGNSNVNYINSRPISHGKIESATKNNAEVMDELLGSLQRGSSTNSCQPALITPLDLMRVSPGKGNDPSPNLNDHSHTDHQPPHFAPNSLLQPDWFLSPLGSHSETASNQRDVQNNTLPQISFLSKSQMIQAFEYLLKTDDSFVSKLHEAYSASLLGQQPCDDKYNVSS